MKKLKNAFVNSTKDFNCFGCSPNNPIGLKMDFYVDGDKFWAKWNPDKNYDGWINVVHGGIQACLVDETAEWYIFTKYGRSAVTSELQIKYKKPLSSASGIIRIEANEISFKRNIAEISLKITDLNNNICTEAIGKFYVFSEEISKGRYNFPDKEEFFK
ncbi:MAG TPA: PaaI family thioesterase [Bacteroidales bacterium]|nr:PaaI family thioesterase [Bacteroidales bacterium]